MDTGSGAGMTGRAQRIPAWGRYDKRGSGYLHGGRYDEAARGSCLKHRYGEVDVREPT